MPNPADGTEQDQLEFIAAMSTQVPHVLDDPGSLWLEHRVLSQPTLIFVDASGDSTIHTGALGPQALLAKVEEL